MFDGEGADVGLLWIGVIFLFSGIRGRAGYSLSFTFVFRKNSRYHVRKQGALLKSQGDLRINVVEVQDRPDDNDEAC